MNKSQNFEFIEPFIPKHEWDKIFKISIFYKEYILLKLLLFINSSWVFHRKYFLKVTYKNRSIKQISISYHQKNLIKPWITNFNFYLSGLLISEKL